MKKTVMKDDRQRSLTFKQATQHREFSARIADFELQAHEWAAANRSDPFALQTARSHMKNNVADFGDYGASCRP